MEEGGDREEIQILKLLGGILLQRIEKRRRDLVNRDRTLPEGMRSISNKLDEISTSRRRMEGIGVGVARSLRAVEEEEGVGVER